MLELRTFASFNFRSIFIDVTGRCGNQHYQHEVVGSVGRTMKQKDTFTRTQ